MRTISAWPLALLLFLGSVATTAVGFLLGAWPLALLGSVVPYLVYLPRVRDGRTWNAWAWVLAWAAMQSVVVVVASLLAPDRAGEVILRGPEYAEEMLHWVRTGEGPEGSPRLYLPVHIRHYLGFCVLSVVTVGFAGLVLGTVLLNYMNFYVAELIQASARPWGAALFGWPIWAVIRVVGFVASGVAMGALGLNLYRRARGWGRREGLGFPARLMATGFGLVVADAVIKALLAEEWRKILLRFFDGGP